MEGTKSDAPLPNVCRIKYPKKCTISFIGRSLSILNVDVEMMRRFWRGFNTDEVSEELFDLTTDILDECGGHYSVW
jgi:hypothetical protein